MISGEVIFPLQMTFKSIIGKDLSIIGLHKHTDRYYAGIGMKYNGFMYNYAKFWKIQACLKI